MAKRLLKDYEEVSVKQENLRDRVDFAHIFGRNCPVHIEIGSGKGTFLVSQSRIRSDINFLGIEWANKYYRTAVDRIGRWGIPNVRIIRTDAAIFLGNYITDESVDFFHIYFPDPWPKKKHHKRRFFNKENMSQILRGLKKGGIVQFATDRKDYFEQAKKVIEAQEATLEKIEFERACGAREKEIVGTNYERKYIKDGREIYTLSAKKTVKP